MRWIPGLLWCVLWGTVEGVFTPIVEIGQGKLRGLRSISGQNRYYGVPYAMSKRFQPPKVPPKWDGVFNAVGRFKHCAQRVGPMSLGTEDCLELDVYSTEGATPADRLPVLVFIHGGAYYYGTKAHYDPEFLVTKSIVAVIINYRVGVLGFLCANGVANLGLKDQVAALKWIRRNIKAFGGDPDNVTVSGQSAGASAAAMHLLSRKSRGLFHKLILMSGTPLTPWAYNVEPLKPAFEDASKIGQVYSEKDVFEVFANASVEDILKATRDVSTNPRYFKYSPCVDANLTDPFFHDTPYNILKSGNFNKVPIVIGFANVEGMLFYGLNNDRTFKEWEENFIERMPSVFSWCPEGRLKRLSQEMRSHYFGLREINRNEIKGVVDYYSDWIAYASVDPFIKLMSRYSDRPVYGYMFEFEGERNFAKMIFGQGTGLAGASHSDDIFYVFKPAGLSLLLSKWDRLFIDRLTTMLTNFMKYGNPTPSKTTLLPVRWPVARRRHDNRTRVLQLARSLAVTDLPKTHQGGFMLQMLCENGQPGFVPCERPEGNERHHKTLAARVNPETYSV